MKKRICGIGRRLDRTVTERYGEYVRVARAGKEFGEQGFNDGKYAEYLAALAAASNRVDAAEELLDKHKGECGVCGRG